MKFYCVKIFVFYFVYWEVNIFFFFTEKGNIHRVSLQRFPQSMRIETKNKGSKLTRITQKTSRYKTQMVQKREKPERVILIFLLKSRSSYWYDLFFLFIYLYMNISIFSLLFNRAMVLKAFRSQKL